jgi:glycerol transport system ATP-binding protein
MTRGRAVQMGTASELFERPRHTFVGNFIGSPGMNFLAATGTAAGLEVAGQTLPAPQAGLGEVTLGVRPEYVALAEPDAPGAVPGVVTQTQDVGTYWLLAAQVGANGGGEATVRVRLGPENVIPRVGQHVWLRILGEHTCFYRNEELIA